MALGQFIAILLPAAFSMIGSNGATQFAGTPTTGLEAAAIPTAYASVQNLHNPVAVQEIHETMALYPYLIDGKQYDHLDLVFEENVWANYSALLGVLHPLSNLQEGLKNVLAKVTTQHALTTQLIDVNADGVTARTATYFTASHFGTGEFYGQGLYAWGTYQDNWNKNLTTGKWRIIQRTLSYPGPFFGNVSIFGS